MPNGWGVHFWMISPRMLFVRFTRRRGRRFTAAVTSRRVLPRRWQFVGATYDGRTGIAKLFVNRRFVASRRVGRIRLATNYPVRMGARVGDKRYFLGRISCMQVYDQPLTSSQILRRKKRCFTKGNIKCRQFAREKESLRFFSTETAAIGNATEQFYFLSINSFGDIVISYRKLID